MSSYRPFWDILQVKGKEERMIYLFSYGTTRINYVNLIRRKIAKGESNNGIGLLLHYSHRFRAFYWLRYWKIKVHLVLIWQCTLLINELGSWYHGMWKFKTTSELNDQIILPYIWCKYLSELLLQGSIWTFGTKVNSLCATLPKRTRRICVVST